MTELVLDPGRCLPEDMASATLLGRAWHPGHAVPGPVVVTVRNGRVLDLSASFPTLADVLNAKDPAGLAKGASGENIGAVEDLLANSVEHGRDATRPWLLAPVDLQALKACGVTFAVSTLERVLEEHAKGDPTRASALRAELDRTIGTELRRIKPGSAEAAELKRTFEEKGMWSPYLEVGLGPDAEVFTKAQPMSSVGIGADIGIHPRSSWSNPEPEVVLVAGASGSIVGATLGNDVNLRDFEGRSALLLGRAKDNNGSCTLGPFIRLLDAGFTLDDVRGLEVSVDIEGPEGFTLSEVSRMSAISRDVADLMAQTFDAHHYPDGVILFTGTLFAPIQDRDEAGMGFTHKPGDIVMIRSPRLGALVNRVGLSTEIAPWTFGLAELTKVLVARAG
ncbi:fumarylacetoacetate hydrolase family protein [Marinivivus vitaminiproducens]|uniref:fumarylacetoacetate hydrolase family protein n=1 Tax=Marinivivus vitaminiproducens TaxID=3035935 RepID=UPI0027A1C134|nr:fumarylacetoacetate hydrolase family protein [Geminicoccaceae bacterium SCSIO 64248]